MNHDNVWEHDLCGLGLGTDRSPFTELVSDLVRAIRGRDPATVAMPQRIARERLGAASGDRCDPRVGDVGTLPWPDASQDFVEECFSVKATREPVL